MFSYYGAGTQHTGGFTVCRVHIYITDGGLINLLETGEEIGE